MNESSLGSRVLRDFFFLTHFYHKKIHFRKKVSTDNNFILVVTLQLLDQLHSKTFSILSGYSRRDLCYSEQKSTSGIHRTG